MRKFVESDKVDLIVGVQGSNIALAALNYIKQSKAFLLVSGAGTDALTWERVPYLFRSSISSWQLCHPMAEWIYDTIAKEMVVISEDYAGGHDVAARDHGALHRQGRQDHQGNLRPPHGDGLQPLSHRDPLAQSQGRL